MLRTALILAMVATTAQAQTNAPGTAPPAPAPVASPPFVAAEGRVVIEALATALERNFVFPDTAGKYAAALRAKLAAGGYDRFADRKACAETVTADLQAVAKDGHLRLFTPEMIAARQPRRRPDGAGRSAVTRKGWIAPGVAYIGFAGFPGDAATLAEVAAFLGAHAEAKTLIIDARENRGGGLAEMDLMFAQLFAAPTTLVTMDTRIAVQQSRGSPFDGVATVKPASAPEGVARLVHSAVPAAGGATLDKAKLYLLTSNKTASAGEHLSLSLKRTGRATLIGETTRGAGHYGGMEPLPGGYAAFIPVGRTFDPATGKGWEGTGVTPDVAVPAATALDEALRRAGVTATGAAALAAMR